MAPAHWQDTSLTRPDIEFRLLGLWFAVNALSARYSITAR